MTFPLFSVASLTHRAATGDARSSGREGRRFRAARTCSKVPSLIMTPAPAISIILPTHNRAGLLPRALESVLAQACDEDFEVIVVDDGSSDGTPAYLAAIADPRLKLLRNESALGAAAARNRGLAAVRAPVTAFLDDDDELLPGFLAASLTAHRQAPAPDLCWTGVLYALPDGREGGE